MLIVGAYIIVAVIILVVVGMIWRRKNKSCKSGKSGKADKAGKADTGVWSMRDQIADLERQQAAMEK